MKQKILISGFLSLAVMPAFALGGLQAILSDSHTLFFIVINLGLTAYFAWFRFDRFAAVHGPEVLTSVGIFGCFIGIALALLNFDTKNVTASVPQLLEGVKTAFWASVTGVGGALLIRLRHKLQKGPIQQAMGAPKASSMDDMVSAIQSLQRSLSGTEEGSLLTQLKLMRQEQSDQSVALRQSFDAFAKKMAEDGSKALIEALKAVIADFNAKINEQFGENFKNLNMAVEKLVIWQQQYKDELDKLQAVQRETAGNLKAVVSGVSTIVERAAGFSDTAEKLDKLLVGLNQQYSIIKQSQDMLYPLLVQMKDVMPQFTKKMEDLTESMKAGVIKVQSEVTDVVHALGVQLKASSSEMEKLLSETLKKSQKEVNDQLLAGLKTVRESVDLLDKGLQEELNKSLQTLGRQLASLSEKFVADYTPLTERLREVVRLAARLE